MQNALNIIFEVTMFSSILILIVLGIKSLLSKKLNAKLVSFLWLMVLVRLILPITMESPIHFGLIANLSTDAYVSTQPPLENDLEENASFVPAESTILINDGAIDDLAIDDLAIDGEAIDGAAIDGRVIVNQPSIVTETSKASFWEKASQVLMRMNVWNYLFISWLAGAMFVLTKSVYRILCFYKKLRSANLMDIDLVNKLASAKKIVGIKKKIRITTSPYVDIPIVYGVLKPVIVLPIGLKDAISTKKLSCILLHELCHVKRYDILKNYIWLVAKTIYWFNPLVHIAYNNYLENVEVVCDERVIKSLEPNDQCEYTQSLLDVMRLINKQNELPLTVSFCKNKSTIKRRVLNIMKPAKKSKAVMLITILIACILMVTCFTTACLKADDQLIVSEKHIEGYMQEIPDVSVTTGVITYVDGVKVAEETTTSPIRTISPQTIESINGFIDTKKVVFNGKEAIKDLAITEIDMIDYIKPNTYFEHQVLEYIINHHTYCTLFESDLSVLYYENYDLSYRIPMQFSDEELIEIATDFAKRFYGKEDIYILRDEAMNYGKGTDFEAFEFIVEGIMGEDEQSFEIRLNGNGDLISYKIFPTNINWEMGVSLEKAKNIAIEQIKKDTYEIDESKLVQKKEYLKTKNAPMYVFEYEYRSDAPTVAEYDFDYYIRVNVSNGDIYSSYALPIVDNIDIMQMDEAEKLAIEHLIENTEHNDVSKYIWLESQSFIAASRGEITYYLSFQYDDEYYYSLNMIATTGEVRYFYEREKSN